MPAMLEGGGFEEAMAAQVTLMNKQAAQIQSAAKGFASSAGDGFHIDPAAAATLIKACMDSLDVLDDVDRHLETIAEAPKLGETPGAQVVAPFTQQSAVYPHGMKPAVDNLKATLNDMMSAYKKASTNYAQTEEALQNAFKS
jgi:hypothetical protein